jgi:hypothetical protein
MVNPRIGRNFLNGEKRGISFFVTVLDYDVMTDLP